jgi:hypothetical protein
MLKAERGLLDFITSHSTEPLPEVCILCGGVPCALGLFVPKKGTKGAAYALCEKCLAKPDSAERAEKIIQYERHHGKSSIKG